MSDAAYMDAVKRGDMKTAQRMVDAAAEAAGVKKYLVRTLFTPERWMRSDRELLKRSEA